MDFLSIYLNDIYDKGVHVKNNQENIFSYENLTVIFELNTKMMKAMLCIYT